MLPLSRRYWYRDLLLSVLNLQLHKFLPQNVLPLFHSLLKFST
nr:MAG TPA: hypothetical protein [Caudoviricetes sp.]